MHASRTPHRAAHPTRGVRVDYVCGNDFRVQNHTGTELTLRVATTAAGTDPESEISLCRVRSIFSRFI